MERATGERYESFVYLLERLTRPGRVPASVTTNSTLTENAARTRRRPCAR